jgi:hypothetical protein
MVAHFLRPLKGSGEPKVHSQGFSSSNVSQVLANVDLNSIRDRLEPMDLNGMQFFISTLSGCYKLSTDFYESLQPRVHFGPMFQRLVGLAGNAYEVLAEVAVPSESTRCAYYAFSLSECFFL